MGGVLGGVLGTKKNGGKGTVIDNDKQGGSITTTSESSTLTSSSTTSSSTTPTPTTVFKPRTDSWYFMKNDVLNPGQNLALEELLDNSTYPDPKIYWDVNESRGDPYEHWGFWPAKLNSTYSEDYRSLQNISEIWIMYNRGLLNVAGITSPTQASVDDLVSWNWFAPHPVAPYMYLKNARLGPEFALTAYRYEEDGYFYLTSNRTDLESYPTEEVKEKIRDGQAWKPELAFAFLKGELGLWDTPAAAIAA